MKLGLLKRIPKEQLAKAGKLPDWIDALLAPLNEFIEKVGIALQGKLTFDDNFLCKPVFQSFDSGVEKEINPYNEGQQTLSVDGVILLSSGTKRVSEFGWYRKTNRNIAVTIAFAGGGSADCKILVLLK